MRILMTCQPELGPAIQLIPLASELDQRGHPVTVATSASFVPAFLNHGLDARAVGPDWMIRPSDAAYDRLVRHHPFSRFPQVPGRLSVKGVLRLAASTGAELIVREYAELTGWAVAKRLGIPLVTQGVAHRLPPLAEDRVTGLMGRLAELAGVEPPEDPDELFGTAYLDVIPPAFRCPWEGEAWFTQPSRPSVLDGMGGRAAAPWLENLGRNRPLVYAPLETAFATAPRVWRAVATALSSLNADAILTTGAACQQARPSAANIHVQRYLPQSQVLPRCAAVVCHADTNTLIGAFRYGVPVVCLPLSAEQPVNAVCCAQAGAGLNLANAVAADTKGPLTDPGHIAEAVRRVLDEPAFAQAAARIGDEIRDMPGPAETARFLEQAAATAVQPPMQP